MGIANLRKSIFAFVVQVKLSSKVRSLSQGGVVVDGKKYHIAIAKGGVTYGFMIVRGSDTRQRVNDWAPIYSTGDQQFAEGTWQPWALTDWTGGVGQERYSNSAQNKFYTSLNCETRIAGRLALGGRWVSADATQVATANPIDFPLVVGNLYVPCGTKLRKYNVGTQVWTDANPGAFAANIAHLHVDGALMFIAVGDSVDAQKYDGTTFTVLTGFKARCFASYGGKVWRANANHIYGSTDAGATWPTDVTVGDASTNVTAMFPYNQRLYVGKEDALWMYDGANVVKVLDFAKQAYSGNFKFMCEWGGSLYFNVLRRVIRFTPTTWNDVTPEITGDANKEIYGFGLPIMFAAMPSMLLVAFKDGENQYANLLGYTGSGWHQVYGPAVATMNAVGYSRNADWIVVNDGSTRRQAQIAQADHSTADYEASGEVVTPWFDGGYPFFKKSGKSVILETRDCSANETVSVDYRTTDGAAWTALGSSVISSSAPTSISLDPINGAIEFYKIQFRLRLARGTDTSKRPTVTRFILLYLNRPESVFAYSVQVKLSSKVRTLSA